MAKVEELLVEINAKLDGFERGMRKAQQKTNTFSKGIKKIGGLIAGAFAVSKIAAFAKSVAKAYDIQVKAERSLLTSLKGRRDIQINLLKQASELQKKTIFGDEETIKAQARLATLLGQNEEAIIKLVPLVQDLATAKGMDLAMAAELVAKSVGSSTNALSRYGVTIEGAVGSSERLESAVAALNRQFKGQSEEAAKVGLSSFQQLSNAFGDFKENIGRLLPGLDNLAKKLTHVFTVIASNPIGKIKLDEIAGGEKYFKFILDEAEQTSEGIKEALREPLQDYYSFIKDLEKTSKQKSEEGEKVVAKQYKAMAEGAREVWNEYIKLFNNEEARIEFLKKQEEKQEEQLGIIQELNKTLEDTKKKREEAFLIDDITKYNNKIEELEQQLKSLELPDKPKFGIEIEEITQDYEELGIDELNEALKEGEKYVDRYGDKLQKMKATFMGVEIVAKELTKSIVGLGASSESMEEFASNVVKSGKRIVAAYIGEGVAAAILRVLTDSKIKWPYNLIVAGIAGGAAAALFNSIVPSFAEGGRVTSPTLAMVGDNPGRDEMIVPSEKYSKVFGNNSTRIFIPSARIRGRDIYISYKEEERRLNTIGLA